MSPLCRGNIKRKSLITWIAFKTNVHFIPVSAGSQMLPSGKKIKVILATLIVWLKDRCVETNRLIAGYLQGIDRKIMTVLYRAAGIKVNYHSSGVGVSIFCPLIKHIFKWNDLLPRYVNHSVLSSLQEELDQEWQTRLFLQVLWHLKASVQWGAVNKFGR